jgi:hypothetical protein
VVEERQGFRRELWLAKQVQMASNDAVSETTTGETKLECPDDAA